MRVLKEHMEFTWDMIRALPKLYHYLESGEDVEVHCKSNLEQLYKIFTPNVKVTNDPPSQAGGSYSYTPPFFVDDNWTPPPLKDMFKGKVEFTDKRPVVTIHNKYTNEWNFTSPVIFLSLEILDELFKLLTPHYNVVYIRPTYNLNGYTLDGQRIHDLGEFELIQEKYPEIVTIQNTLEKNPSLDYNQAQFALLASSDKHIAVAGGNACVSAYFGGEVLIFNCPDCPSHDRGIWKTGSWLELLSKAKIYGYQSYTHILEHVKTNWVD